MSKPDDIPQDVWDAACRAWDSTDFPGREMTARAIIAAKADEREACAQIADDAGNPYKGGSRGVAQEQAHSIAAAIRNR